MPNAQQTECYRAAGFSVQPLVEKTFGATVWINEAHELSRWLDKLETEPQALLDAFYAARGLLVLKDMRGISEQPSLLLRISRLFGNEVENYRETLTPEHMIHADVPEILLLSNQPPCSREPPPQPKPPQTADGALPVQFPHRRGWHTDQSFRRPPPDVSLFYAVVPAPRGQGQTLLADGIAAYEALPVATKSKIANLDGLHALLGTGRSEQAVRASEPVTSVLEHQRSQRQPLVRVHPVTGARALYLCESGQMDWHDGPVVGLQPGTEGDGAALIYQLMSHCTQPAFTYTHEWSQSDLVIYDNRNLLHSATWYDSTKNKRLMWRTTVSGNPGAQYEGEVKSWIPASDTDRLQGLGDGRWDSAAKTSI
jgi:taurine dioxygenase